VWGRDKLTNQTCVIKWRRKRTDFTDDIDRKNWLAMMTFLYDVHTANKRMPRMQYMSQVLEILDDDEHLFVVCSRVVGCDTFEFFDKCGFWKRRQQGNFSLEIARQITVHVLNAVEELHAVGITHGDLKLENMVCELEPEAASDALYMESLHQIKLIDFDTCTWGDLGERAGGVTGTSQYMAPERFEGVRSPAGDLWSLGIICYTLITGSFPFPFKTFRSLGTHNRVGHPAVRRTRQRLERAAKRIRWSDSIWSESGGAEAKLFVSTLLRSNSCERLTMKDAKASAWIQNIALQ
jgi:serine/threonine protein kinase